MDMLFIYPGVWKGFQSHRRILNFSEMGYLHYTNALAVSRSNDSIQNCIPDFCVLKALGKFSMSLFAGLGSDKL